MNLVKLGHILIFLAIGCMALLSGCKATKDQPSESGKKLPGTIAITPTSFRCEGIVIESNTKSVNFKITKMLEQGSSLFYSVSAGDTLTATFQSPNKANYAAKNVELLIEERIMLNSEKPDFIVRQIHFK